MTNEEIEEKFIIDNSKFIIVPKSKIEESGDWNLSGERYKQILAVSNNYEMVELGDVVEILDSLRKPITKSDRISGKYPYYGATGIVDWVNEYIFDERLVLLGEDGAKWSENEKSAFIADGEYWVNNHAHVLRVDNEKIIDTYLVEVLNVMDLNPFITGITVPKLNQKMMRGIQIPLPPLSVQEEIVAEIDGYQKIIDGARQVVENYKPTIKINPDWEMVKLGEVCEKSTNSINPQTHNGEVKYVGLENIEQNTGGIVGDLETEISTIKSTKMKFKNGDVLYGKLRPNLNKVHYCNFEGICSTDIFVLLCDTEKANPIFYSNVLRSESFNKEVLKGLSGAQLPRVGWNYFSTLIVPLPPLSVQKEIVAKIEAEQEMVNTNKKLIEIYEQKTKDKIGEVWGE